MHTLEINIEGHPECYPIYIGHGLLEQADWLSKHVLGTQVMIVSNPTVAAHYLKTVSHAFNHCQCDVVLLPDGETYKNLDAWSRVLDALITEHHHRDTTVIALGGGVVGDTAGFAAAAYQRGVRCVQIPTTLLAQVDASIGGKTAINHAKGKNMIGAFHSPHAVIIDVETLATLDDRQFRSGLAEVVKAALIQDIIFFEWLEAHIDAILARKTDVVSELIQKSCAIKALIVSSDVFERGQRALLNLGHTFGHAIEQAYNYTTYLHGEAVSIGLVLAAKLSYALNMLSKQDVTRVKNILSNLGLPITLPTGLTYERLEAGMRVDKKIMNNATRFVLLNALGTAVVSEQPIDKDIVCKVVNDRRMTQ